MMLISNNWLSQQQQESLIISAWQRLVNLMAELCGTPAGFIVQADDAEFKVVIANEKPENPYAAGSTISANVNIFCRKVVELDSPLYEGKATENKAWADNPEVTDDGFNTYLGYPLHWPDGSVFGTICVMDLEKSEYDERYHTLLNHFRDMAEKELELCDKNLQLKNIAFHDDLTQVLNRKGFFDRAVELISQSSGQNDLVHMCYFDLDNLKPINDSYGHGVGDQVIQRFAEHLSSVFASKGVVARFGGDEFVVMLTGYDDLEVEEYIDQLYQIIVNENLSPELFYSVGHVSAMLVSAELTSLETLIREADKKMYQNKQSRDAKTGE